MLKRILGVSFLAVLALSLPGGDGWAASRGLSLIRDAEIEDTIRAYATPLFAAAGLDAEAVSVHLVSDPQINAFVAGGQRIFIFTGLLLAADSPGQVIGVIAHELGHIMGGHLARTQDALRNASSTAILSMVLGVAAAVAGAPDVGGAVMAGGQHVAERALLQYSRAQESAADQAALKLLDRLGYSAEHMLALLETLADQQALLATSQDPYIQSHPLTAERIATIRGHIERGGGTGRPYPPELATAHARMQAKIEGFLKPPRQTLGAYPATDRSLQARYARAIALYRIPRLEAALAEIDGLIAEHPADPYFLELKGQMLFENGRTREAMAPYERAVAARPGAPLLKVGLATVQIALEDPALDARAIDLLDSAVRADRDNPGAWRQLAIAYGRSSNLGLSALASAEENLLVGRHDDARMHAEHALARLPEGSPGWLKAQDILNATARSN